MKILHTTKNFWGDQLLTSLFQWISTIPYWKSQFQADTAVKKGAKLC